MIVDEDDDSSNDSDYNPNGNDDVDVIDSIDNKNCLESSEISYSRKRKVESVWNDLLQSEKSDLINLKKKLGHLDGSSTHTSYYKSTGKGRKSIKNIKNQKILESIFGKSQANAIISNVSDIKVKAIDNTSDIKEIIKDSVLKVQKKQKVNEIRKFAGKEIVVETTKLAYAYPGNNNTIEKITVLNKKSSTGIDAVLDTIKGPKQISTIAKSSIDWDNYKEKEGLEDELAASTKDGYLTRKEFLERCDLRAFENEKSIRLESSI